MCPCPARPGAPPRARGPSTEHLIQLELIGAPEELRRPAGAALAAAGVEDGHLAIELVDEARMAELNSRHRGVEGPTDVLSFPVDEADPGGGPRELGDVVICPPRTEDLPEAVVHGVLHLCGYDHESDGGEMLAVQDRVVAGLR